MAQVDRKFWFPLKAVGIGWGIPNSWQGWVVIGIYCSSVLAVAFMVEKPFTPILVLTAVLLIICWLKGERPRLPGRQND
jgi:hypothetical protein